MYTLFQEDDPTIKPENGAELDIDYWPSFGAQAALDLPLLGPGPGGNEKDFSPTPLTVIPTSGVTWSGNERVFDGSSGQLTVAKTSFANGLGAATLIFDVTPTNVSTAQHGLFSKSNAASNAFLDVIIGVFNAGDVFFRVGATTTYSFTAGGVVAANARSQIACVFNGAAAPASRLAVYVNGKPISVTSTAAAPAAIPTLASNPLVGRYFDQGTSSKYFVGRMRQHVFLPCAMNADQAAAFTARPWYRFSRRTAVGISTAAPTASGAGGLLASASLRASSLYAAVAGISTTLGKIASSLYQAAGAVQVTASETVQTNLASGSMAAQAAALESVLANLLSASGNVQGSSVEEVLTNLISASGNISGSSARVASSIISVLGELRALSSQSTFLAAQGVASLTSSSSTEVLNNLLTIQEHLSAAAGFVASSLYGAVGQVQGLASAAVLYNLLSVAEFIEALATELASSLEAVQAGSGARATVIASNLYGALARTGAHATVVVLGSKLLLFQRRRLDLL